MKRAFLMAGLAALMGAGAAAQEAATKPQTERFEGAASAKSEVVQPAAKQLSPFNKASTFIGSAVKSPDGKAMGKVQDLVFDLERGELAYAVVALDSATGKGRNVAVPTRALKAVSEGDKSHLVLNMSEAVVAAAEGLQDGDWPGTDIFAVGGPAGAESGTASSEEK